VIRIDGLRAFVDRLEQLDLPAVKSHGLEAAASRLHDAVTELLSGAPGDASDLPALRTSELRASIAHTVSGDEAVIFSTSDVAVAQEMGTVRTRPRPFFAPIAAQHTEAVMRATATALREAAHGDSL